MYINTNNMIWIDMVPVFDIDIAGIIWYNLDIRCIHHKYQLIYFSFICMSLLGTVFHLAKQHWAIIACGNTGYFWYSSFCRSSCCTISSLWDSAQSMSAVKNHGKDQHQCSWCLDQLKPSWVVLNPKNHGIKGYTPLWRYGFWRSMNKTSFTVTKI